MAAAFVTYCVHFLLLLVLMMDNLRVWQVNGAPIHAEVKQFPDFDGPLPSKHYAG